MKKIVFFDLDGTLIDGPSSEKMFFWLLLKRHYLGLKQLSMALQFIFRWFAKYRWEVFVKNKAYLYDLSVNEINVLAKDFTLTKLFPKLRQKLQERLEVHRKNGDFLILLTGCPNFIANIFAKHLAVDEVYATECIEYQDHFSAAPPLQHPYALEKLRIAQEVCKKHGQDIKVSIAYANSINDSSLLKEVGTAVAVTPDYRLRAIAKKRGWEILN